MGSSQAAQLHLHASIAYDDGVNAGRPSIRWGDQMGVRHVLLAPFASGGAGLGETNGTATESSIEMMPCPCMACVLTCVLYFWYTVCSTCTFFFRTVFVRMESGRWTRVATNAWLLEHVQKNVISETERTEKHCGSRSIHGSQSM